MPDEVRYYQEFEPVLLDHMVRSEVPSANMGIDRYLSGAARSRRERYQVDCGPPTLLQDVGLCVLTHGYVH